MSAIRNILCPVDLSPISHRALEYAVAIGRALNGRVKVLEVVDTALPPLPPGPWPRVEMTGEMRRAYCGELQTFVEFAREQLRDVEISVADGPVVPRILEAAGSMPADLIVMGTHGRGGFDRFVVGSIVEKVLRKAPCPVLAVPSLTADAHAHPVFRTIVCAIDFAPASLAGLQYAKRLAARGGRLILAHSIGWPFGEDTSKMPPPIDALRRSLERDAAVRLRQAAKRIDRAGLDVALDVRAEKPYAHILRCAREQAADLIVMGLHSHASNELALLGSTTNHVIRDAPCPVLTVRRAPDAVVVRGSEKSVL
jgi:nucleotide-binding universal stress UspA family protein